MSAAPPYGSLRKSFRFGRALAGGAEGIRNYLHACFAAGTGEHSEKAVEEFRPGDRVVSTSFAPIWHLRVVRTFPGA